MLTLKDSCHAFLAVKVCKSLKCEGVTPRKCSILNFMILLIHYEQAHYKLIKLLLTLRRCVRTKDENQHTK